MIISEWIFLPFELLGLLPLPVQRISAYDEAVRVVEEI